MGLERRHFVRWQINWQAKVKSEEALDFASCIINDISFKGLRISSKEKLEKDRFLRLNIVLSDKDKLCLDIEAWVVWHKIRDGFNVYGLYLAKIKDIDKEKIYQFIRHNFAQLVNIQWWSGIRKEGGEIMQEQNFVDRRIFGRFSAKIPLRFINLRENSEGEATTEDIGAKGIGFMAKEELKPRTPLEMWLQIPDKGEPLYTRGEVVWSKMVEPNRHRIGVSLERADLMGLSRVMRVIG